MQKGHSVTVISRNSEKQKDIEALGAEAAVGTMEDVNFLTSAFTGADAVYCMIAPAGGDFSDPNQNVQHIMASADKIANNYLQAIGQSGVKRVVYLSSVGAHTDKDNGILAFHHKAENTLQQLPSDVSITFMRPVGFYTTLLNQINPIKTQGVIASNYGADDTIPCVSPIDIAAAVAEEITSPMDGRKVRYVVSEVLTCNETANILGAAIGKPDLKWIVITDEQMLNGLKSFGMNASLAESFVDMNVSTHSGAIYEDYYRNRPVLGKVKMKDFAKEFALEFNQK